MPTADTKSNHRNRLVWLVITLLIASVTVFAILQDDAVDSPQSSTPVANLFTAHLSFIKRAVVHILPESLSSNGPLHTEAAFSMDSLQMTFENNPQLLIGIGAVVVAFILLFLLFRGARKRSDKHRMKRLSNVSDSVAAYQSKGATSTTQDNGLKLMGSLEKSLMNNLRELRLVEGNLLGESKNSRTFYVTSCTPSASAVFASFQTAYGLSLNKSSSVLLVDGDLEVHSLHTLFDVSQKNGLMDVLQGRLTLDEAVRPLAYNGMHLLTFGAPTDNPENFLRSKAFRNVLAEMRERFDYVVFEGASTLGTSHASLVADSFDGAIVVVECEETKWEVLEMTRDKITHAGGNVLGAILNHRKYYIPKFLYGRI